MAAKVFFGYPSAPEATREALYLASESCNRSGVESRSWEDVEVSGRLIIRTILDEIDAAGLCVFDVSSLNQNVLFELGYAIAKEKRLVILLEKSDRESQKRLKDFELLSNVGYFAWSNSHQIVEHVLVEANNSSKSSLFADLVETSLQPAVAGSLFMLPSGHDTNGTRELNRRMDAESHRGVRVVVADPTESAIQPLQWYAAKVYETQGSIIQFDAPRRFFSEIRNPRSALVAGIAVGFGRPTLMLAEDEYAPPLDYGDILFRYRNSKEVKARLEEWLPALDLTPRWGARVARPRIATELRSLRFGEHVAENEIDTLADYYVETSAFEDVLSERNALFVGRKGTGKTASMFQAASRLSADARNLVVVIKPASYEYASLLSLLSSLPVSLQQYSIEALWKFLLQAEIASKVIEGLQARTAGVPYTEDEKALLEFVDNSGIEVRGDFGTRFERTIATLIAANVDSMGSEADSRDRVNEALHNKAIVSLRSLLGPVLKSKRRVAVLIDNLDKAWGRSSDLELLSKLLLGLLSATGRVSQDFEREDFWRQKVKLTVATFIRSDIFSALKANAREPDKMQVSAVRWEDPEVLLRVLEERFLSARPEGADVQELWTRFFCASVRGESVRDYLVGKVLPRPRDLIFLCNAAIVSAADRGHARVEEEDFVSAELTYSRFAFEALLVENGITIEAFQKVLFEFLGGHAILAEDVVRAMISRAGIEGNRVEHVLQRLKAVCFLGVETANERFEFPESEQDGERASALAEKFSRTSGKERRVSVHSAYRAYLELSD